MSLVTKRLFLPPNGYECSSGYVTSFICISEYGSNEDLIPRNASVIIARVPIGGKPWYVFDNLFSIVLNLVMAICSSTLIK